jgi:transcriptional accessory protein Tex/SPT6
MLHEEKLEPTFILSQCHWEYQAKMYASDFQKIFTLDAQWQAIWAKYHRISQWEVKLRERQVPIPSYISERLQSTLFDEANATQEIEDLYHWFKVVHGEAISKLLDVGEPVLTGRMSRQDDLLRAVHKYKLHEHLGAVESKQKHLQLREFGISPEQLGENVSSKDAVRPHDVKPDEDFESIPNVCKRVVVPDSPISTSKAVLEAIVVYLSRRIASEPRVRKYVRQHFRNHCCVSTTPTEKGIRAATDASLNFKDEYRAFHVVNRPITKFDTDDTLFLDILNLQRQGLITFHYSLCIAQTTKKGGYKVILEGTTEKELMKRQAEHKEHYEKWVKAGEVPEKEKEVKQYYYFEDLRAKLEATARAHEVIDRCKAADVDKTFEMFQCAKMKLNQAIHLNTFLAADFIEEKVALDFCYTEQVGEKEFQIVEGPWNTLRRNIVKRALQKELYPMLWTEMQAYLARRAEEVVCERCVEALRRKIDMQPFKITSTELQEQKQQKNTALPAGTILPRKGMTAIAMTTSHGNGKREAA